MNTSQNVARLIGAALEEVRASLTVTTSWSVECHNNTVTIITSDARVFRCTVEEVSR